MKKISVIALLAAFGVSGIAQAAPSGTANVYLSSANVTGGFEDATGQGISALFDVKPGTKVGFSANNIHAWGDSARFFGLRYLADITPDVFVDTNVGFSDKGKITPEYRVNALVNFKVTEQRNVILGIGADHYTMRGGGEANALLSRVVWYVPDMPVVMQAGATYTVSKMNDRDSWSGYVAGTYGRVGQWTATAKYATGRVHYELVSHPGSVADYENKSFGLSGQYWMSRDWGLTAEVSASRNDYFDRQEIRVGAFYNF